MRSRHTLNRCIPRLSVHFVTSTFSSTLRTIHKLKTLLEQEGVDAFRRPELFPVCLLLLNNNLSEELEDIIPNRATRLRTRENPTNDHTLHYGYLLRGKTDDSLALVKDNIMILDNLIQRLEY